MSFHGGITPAPYLCTYKPANVTISDKIEMRVRKELAIGWYRDKDWNLHQVMTDYTGGFLISKEPFLYGKFSFKCNLPSWRGAWTAVWVVISGIATVKFFEYDAVRGTIAYSYPIGESIPYPETPNDKSIDVINGTLPTIGTYIESKSTSTESLVKIIVQPLPYLHGTP